MERLFIDEVFKRGHMAATYLFNNTKPDGSFNYHVNARTGIRAEDYNLLRHAGVVFEACEWMRVTGNDLLLERMSTAILYLEKHLYHLGDAAYLLDNNEIKLGGAALTLLALCSWHRLTGDSSQLSTMKALALFIRKMQTENGDFYSHLGLSGPRSFANLSVLYGGQSLYALMYYYALCPEIKWLASARRYICFARLNGIADPAIHTWLARGLAAFNETEPGEGILRMVHEIGTDAIKILYENVRNFQQNIVPENSKTTSQIVSIGEAIMPLVEQSLLLKETELLLLSVKAVRHVLEICFSHQVIEDRSLNSINFFGGLINSKTDHSIRIDVVQHFLSSITRLLRLSSIGLLPQTAS